jgi:sulfur-oxidizing protein SoxZ
MTTQQSDIKITAKNKNNLTTVRVLMPHPMESGYRKDKKSGKLIPANFIQEMICESGGKTRLSAVMGGGVSSNPYISFKFHGKKGDMVRVTWVDNRGMTESNEVQIK